MTSKRKIMADTWRWEPDPKPYEQGMEVKSARNMVLADLEVMDVDDFLDRKPSSIVYELTDAMISSMKGQLNQVMSVKNIDNDLEELGIETEGETLSYKRIIDTVQINYMMGCSIIGHYLSIMEHIKENIDG